MPQELAVHAVHEGEMRFKATAGEHEVTVDYPLTAGVECAGMTSLQLLLTSLATCAGNTLGVVLRKMKRSFDRIEVTARGSRRDEHPTVLTAIHLEFLVDGAGLEPETVERALAIAEEQLCPVWAMLKPGTPITHSFQIAAE